MRRIADIEQLRRYIITLQEEIAKQDETLERQAELLRQSISKSEHDKILERQRREYELKLSAHPPRIHNERGAGRKPKLTDEIKARVLVLHAADYSQAKAALAVSAEFGVPFSRSTIGSIVRNAGRPRHPPEAALQTTKPTVLLSRQE